MLVTVTDATGMDVEFKDLQVFLHNRLMKLWGLNPAVNAENAKYMSYGRCYKNRKDNGFIAEVFTGSSQYKEVYWDDSLSAISFFGLGDTVSYNNQHKADAHLVFFVNISKLKPTLVHRADEEVRWDVINLLTDAPGGFIYKGLTLGLENILKEYPGSIRDELKNIVEMHPIHCFRLDLELTYDNNNINQAFKNF